MAASIPHHHGNISGPRLSMAANHFCMGCVRISRGKPWLRKSPQCKGMQVGCNSLSCSMVRPGKVKLKKKPTSSTRPNWNSVHAEADSHSRWLALFDGKQDCICKQRRVTIQGQTLSCPETSALLYAMIIVARTNKLEDYAALRDIFERRSVRLDGC